MIKPKHFLITGGIISALISIIHLILFIKPKLFSYIDPGNGSAIVQKAEQGGSLTIIGTIALALIFAIWALYAFSGARLIVRLPMLRTALVTIGIIYLLRALFFPSEIYMVLIQGYSFRFVAYSTISLVAGLSYLFGFFKLTAFLAAGEKS
jgi:hypothetical protein